jgi:hypothetical protein
MSDTAIEWSDFKNEARNLVAKAKDEGSSVVFRGQASSDWRLQTTLERSDLSDEVADYFQTILRIKREVESFTGLSWEDAPSRYDLDPDIFGGYERFSSRLLRGEFPHYSYLAYLRHHGFPSPLLDWSASPMVAAFFAFRSPSESDRVAIYAYRERDASGMKSGGSDEPSIRLLGPYVTAPKRHFVQRSVYTMCTLWQSEAPYFYDHTNVCKPYDPNAEYQQDIVFKFELASSKRGQVLEELESFNLNAYTLFGSEDGLMESLARRAELDLA